jgi:hypothetical protein
MPKPEEAPRSSAFRAGVPSGVKNARGDNMDARYTFQPGKQGRYRVYRMSPAAQ